MVEVFKTNVDSEYTAMKIANALHRKFQFHKVNFDLEDCDNILRVESTNGIVKPEELLQFLKEFDIDVEILPD